MLTRNFIPLKTCNCVGIFFVSTLLFTSPVNRAEVSRAEVHPWDITDTGQPFKDVEFSVTEGTWMAVDISPDGQSLIFDLLGDIYTMPATGGNARLLHGGPAIERTPKFSPDGNSIVYISDRSGSDNVWVSSADGRAARQISQETENTLAAPNWSVEGNYIIATKQSAVFDKMRSSQIDLFHKMGGSGRVLIAAPTGKTDVQEAVMAPSGGSLYYTERIILPHIYVDANHENYAIKRRDLNTGEEERILQGFGGAFSPQVSPNGKKIAFIRRVKSKTVLFIYDIESGKQQPVYDQLDRDAEADFVPQAHYYPPFDWFPDNRHIAIWGKGKLYNIDTAKARAEEIPFRLTARHRITTSPRFSQDLAPKRFRVKAIRHLALSPNGKVLTFSAIGHLWQKKLPGGKPRRISQTDKFEFEPSYSSDGRHLAYVQWDDELGSQLMMAKADGSAAKVVTTSTGVIREPSFSPNGKRLVFRIEASSKGMGGYRALPGIYQISTGGEQKQHISDIGESPAFSADGTRVYFNMEDRRSGSVVNRLRSVDLSGLDQRDHAYANGADRYDIQLSPDGRWITFRDHQQYYLMPYLETGAPLRLNAENKQLPLVKLTELSGYALEWSQNSSELIWVLGASLYRVSVSEKFLDKALAAQPNIDIGLVVTGDIPSGSIAFTHGRIITMRGEEVMENGTVLVTGNRIVAVGKTGEINIPANAKIYNIAGKTLMPGLVDMHGHIDCCYQTGSLPQKQGSRYAALAFGITTNFDPYSTELESYELNETNKAGITVAPRNISVGHVIYGRKGKSDHTYEVINTIDDARKIMARKLAMGGTVIKSYKQSARQKRQQLIKAGREAGIMVDVEGESHFYNNLSMILDGHMSLEHNLPLANYYHDIVQLMARADIANTPTLVVTFAELFGENYFYQHSRAWEDPRIKTYVQESTSSYSPLGTPYSAPPHVRGMTSIYAVDEIYDIGFRSVSRSTKKLDDAGVLINVGSHGQIPGLMLHGEMWLLSEGGMSNHRILRAATLNGAKTLGLDRQIGSIDVGKLADLIVLDANPLVDIKHAKAVVYSMVNGRLYDTSSMNEIGNYDRPRSKFYWELEDYKGIDWNEAWSEK